MKGIAIRIVLLTFLAFVGCKREESCRLVGFLYRNGWCDICYWIKGDEVTDILITARTKRNYYDPVDKILHLPEGDVRFGTQGMAYIFDGTNWSRRALVPFHYRNIPSASSLAQCNAISEIAERVLAHSKQP